MVTRSRAKLTGRLAGAALSVLTVLAAASAATQEEAFSPALPMVVGPTGHEEAFSPVPLRGAPGLIVGRLVPADVPQCLHRTLQA